ncbi:MAG: LamG-like jellyroll fold domain-containing protein [Bacteroidota bacterium]
MKTILQLSLIFALFAQTTLSAQTDYALQFDQTKEQRILYSTSSGDILDTKLNSATDYTIEFWVKPTSTDVIGRVLLKRWNQFAITLWKNDADENVHRRFYLTRYNNDGTAKTFVNTKDDVINLNEWNHIAVICNSTDNTIKLYANGVDVTNDTETAADVVLSDAPESSNLYVGYGGGGTYFTGLIDKIRIKNTAETIGSLQTSVTDAAYTTDDNTAVLYNFNENTGLSTVNEADSKNADFQCQKADCVAGEIWWIDISSTASLGKNNTTTFSIFPNPSVAKEFVIQANSNETIQKVEMFDILGKAVKTIDFSNNISSTNIDVQNLHTGIYFVKTSTDKGIGTRKIIIR